MNQKITILGGGESGVGAAVLAKRQGYDTFVSDYGAISENYKKILEKNFIPFEENQHTKEKIFNADLVIKSPGIPDKVALIQEIKSKNIPVISEIEFAFLHIKNEAKIIAITGTNGKTTTTLLTYHLLKSAGLNVALGGNIGTSFACLVAEKPYDYYVIEVSSFQLDGIQKFKPNVAVILNITPDHLDRYEYDIDKYASSKLRIAENQNENDTLIYSSDNQLLSSKIELLKSSVKKQNFSLTDSNTTAYLVNEKLHFKSFEIATNLIPLIGQHNMSNCMAACMAAQAVGVHENEITKGIQTFVNAPHRLEKVAVIDGVTYINDSKATNVDAVFYALDGIKEKIVWIVGGVDKGNDYSQIEKLVQEKVSTLICLGKDNEALKKFFGGKVEKIVESQKMSDAIAQAGDLASHGEVVLLSPACASFDLFKNYEDRGDQFREEVKKLVNTAIEL